MSGTRSCDSWEEVSINVPWGTIQGKWWGPREKQPVLALHGWQDNCGSFDRLCPLLPAHIPILCIDLPGHGHSSHYPVGMQYFIFWDGIALIRRIVLQFQWKKMILMGHSLGGSLTFLYAATYPDDVEKLINIDIAGPTVRNMDKLANAMGPMIDKWLSYERLTAEKIPSYEYNDMVQLLLAAYDGSVDEEAAKILLKRGSKRNMESNKEDALYFTRDVRLKMSGLAQFTAEQVLSFAKRIRCDVLNIRANPGMQFDYPHIYGEVIDILRKGAKSVTFITVPGTHHVHLVSPSIVAEHISKFLENT